MGASLNSGLGGNTSMGGKGGVGQAGQPNMPQGNQTDGAPTDVPNQGITSGQVDMSPQGLYNQYANTVFGNPNPGSSYTPTFATQNNPNVSIGFGMPPGGNPTQQDLGGFASNLVTGFGNMVVPGTGYGLSTPGGFYDTFGQPKTQPQPQPQQGLPTAGMPGGKGLGGFIGDAITGFGNMVVPGTGYGLSTPGGFYDTFGQPQPVQQSAPVQQPRVSNTNLQNPRTVAPGQGQVLGAPAHPVNRFAPPNAPGVRPRQVAGVVPALANKFTRTRTR